MLEPWAVWSGLWLGSFAPKVSLQFLSTTYERGTTHSTTSLRHTRSLRLSAHLHVCAPPTHLEKCGLFKSLVVRLLTA